MKIKRLSHRKHEFKSGYLLVEEKVFKFYHKTLEASYDAFGDTPEEKVQYFKDNYKNEIDEMPSVVYYDDEGVYQSWMIEDSDELISEEAYDEKNEDYYQDRDDFLEYCLNH